MLVNAVYRRSYEVREPIEVRIEPDELVVLSFPGPDRSIRPEELQAGGGVDRRYRNRRTGEFLKELGLAKVTVQVTGQVAEQVTGEVTREVGRLLQAIAGEMHGRKSKLRSI